MAKPNKNQTASVLSLALFNWLNETVWEASQVPHLPLDDLPVLADNYKTENLVKEAFPVRIFLRVDRPPPDNLLVS